MIPNPPMLSRCYFSSSRPKQYRKYMILVRISTINNLKCVKIANEYTVYVSVYSMIDYWNIEILSFFNLKSPLINVLVSSFRFIWIPICYGSMVIRNVWLQILTSKVDPRAERVKPLSSRIRIALNRLPESIRENSWSLIRTVWMVRSTAAARMPVVSKYLLPPSRHEWLIRRENLKLCVRFGDLFIRIVRTIRSAVRLG